jgi:hypothetical protein
MQIISYHIISYHIISYHIIRFLIYPNNHISERIRESDLGRIWHLDISLWHDDQQRNSGSFRSLSCLVLSCLLLCCAVLCCAVLCYSELNQVIEGISTRNIQKIVLTSILRLKRCILSFTDFGESLKLIRWSFKRNRLSLKSEIWFHIIGLNVNDNRENDFWAFLPTSEQAFHMIE